MAHDADLLVAVLTGEFSAAEAALAAGANANYPYPGPPHTPILAATMNSDAGIVKLLLEQGADPDTPTAVETPVPSSGDVLAAGKRALHIAANSGHVEIVRLLLKQGHADPNTTDSDGYTPLMVACNRMITPPADVVRLLLEAGADPTLAEANGYIPLHRAAQRGHTEFADILYSRALFTLDHHSPKGETPLFLACSYDHESMVSKLLSLGAIQPPPLSGRCPLVEAVIRGLVGVVRVLINEGGIEAVGGDAVLPRSMGIAVRFGRARILRLLLSVDGKEGRLWANAVIKGRYLLHDGAGCSVPAAVSLLLEAGADEAPRDSLGRIPGDIIGAYRGRFDDPQMNRRKDVAIRRMLQRGPAYRARSWLWPSDEEETDATVCRDRDTAGAALTSAATVPSFPPTVNTPPVIGVRIFRLKEKGRSKFFMRLVDR